VKFSAGDGIKIKFLRISEDSESIDTLTQIFRLLLGGYLPKMALSQKFEVKSGAFIFYLSFASDNKVMFWGKQAVPIK
jgi:hypothetical protein